MKNTRKIVVLIIVVVVVCCISTTAFAGSKGNPIPAKNIGENTDLVIKSSRLMPIHVAALPGSPTAGDTYWVDDATSACVLGAGGGGAEAEFKWDGSAWVGSLCSTGTGLAATDIDTLSELNGIIGDANIYSTAQVDALLAKSALQAVLDLEATDSPTYAGMTLNGVGGLELGAAGSVQGTVRWYSNTPANNYHFDLYGANYTENFGWRVPTQSSGGTNFLINVDADGTMGYTDPATFGGYTNLTSFVAQTPWRVFYSNADGDVTELALGDAGTVLKSNGATSAPSFQTDSTGAGGDQLVDIVATSPLLVNAGAAVNDALPGSDADITFSMPAATASTPGHMTAAQVTALEAIDTAEERQDEVGGMWTGNTETGITITYQDDDGTIDAVVTTGTDTALGIVELSTDAESVTGTSDAVVVTPGNLSARLAAPGAIGGTTPAAGTFTTLSAGGGGFQVDAEGGTTMKNYTLAKTPGQAGDTGWYEANSTDTHAAGFRGPASITGDGAYRGQFANARATSANMVQAWTNVGETGSGTAADPYVQAISWVDLDDYLLQSVLGSNVLTFLGTPSLSNLFSAVTDEGTGVATAMGNAVDGASGLATYSHTVQYSATPVIDDPDNFAANFTGGNLYGGTFIANAAGTAALPDPAIGMNFTVVLETTGAVIFDPLGTGTADTIVMNGLAAAADENITAGATGALGDMCVFQYRAANSWMATCTGWAEATPP